MTDLKNSPFYLDAESISELLKNEWDNLVSVVESALKSYSAGNIQQPVRASVPIKKSDGYKYFLLLF